jgi:mitochondrial chaperone BCS1
MAELTASTTLMTLLESSIPGLSLATKFFSEYLHVDISQYLGVVLVVIALSAVVNYCADGFWHIWGEYFMSTAEIRNDDEMYNYLMYWISRNELSKRTTHFVAGTRTNSSHVDMSEDSDDEDYAYDYDDVDLSKEISKQCQRWDRMKTLRFTPSNGTHYFRYKGHWLSFTRSQEREKGFYGARLTEEIYLSCFGRNPQILKVLLQEAQMAYLERDGNKTVIYRSSRPYGGTYDDLEWVRCMSRPPRPMSTVVLDEAQKQMILDDMKDYLHPRTKKWYANRGIPYRRGYLLHGQPGTGKTSLCFALAGLLHLKIYVASLNSRGMTDDSLASIFLDLPSRCIVLLEDIDAAGLAVKRQNDTQAEKKERNREEDKSVEVSSTTAPVNTDNVAINKGISLSGFLNVIDGVASSEGRILVMTTNHIEKLDSALLRPGRVDLTIRFGYANFAMIKGLFMAIYSTLEADALDKYSEMNGVAVERQESHVVNRKFEMSVANGYASRKLGCHRHCRTDKEIGTLAEHFAKLVPADKFTPAEIQGYLLKHKTNPKGAIQGLEKWMERREERKAGKHKDHSPAEERCIPTQETGEPDQLDELLSKRQYSKP